MPWRYSAVRCGVEGLAGFLSSRGPEWLGLSLTMPLKEEAWRLADTLDPVARESGVVNTLRHRADGGWDGFNTDVAGLAAALVAARLDVSRTIVVGTGATAVSAVLAARQLGAERIWVAGRNVTAATAIAERFDCIPTRTDDPALTGAAATLVIATLPGPAGTSVMLPAALFGVPLFDVAYEPWPSPLAGRWNAAGGAAHPGTDMLVEQAIVQVRIFREAVPGAPLPGEAEVRAAMRAAVRSDMGG